MQTTVEIVNSVTNASYIVVDTTDAIVVPSTGDQISLPNPMGTANPTEYQQVTINSRVL